MGENVLKKYCLESKKRYYNGKGWQIHSKHSTIREFLTTGVVIMDHVRTNDKLVDPLTKGLAREKVFKTLERIGLKPIEIWITSEATWKTEILKNKFNG